MRAGKFALRIEGSDAARRGDLDRIAFQHQPIGNGTAEGTERFFGWSVFLPNKFTNSLHSLGYFETRNSWTRLMAFDVHGEDILFTTRVPYAQRWHGKGKLTANRWHDFAVHVLWSHEATKGFVEGQKLMVAAGVPVAGDTGQGLELIWLNRYSNLPLQAE